LDKYFQQITNQKGSYVMNKIYLSGIIAEPPVRFTRDGAPDHVSFHLCVSHKTRQGVIKRELYPIHAWNGVAGWVRAHLQHGQRVLVQGYLTQRTITAPDGEILMLSEVTAEEFFQASGGGNAHAAR
jgi:single-stranded DNA-binding protein